MALPAGHRRAELALALVTIIWGASFTFVKAALDDVSTVAYLAMRFSLASAVLLLAWRGAVARGPGAGIGLRAGILAGLCLAAGYILQTSGLRLTSASKSAFLTALNVVLVPLLASLVYQTAPRLVEWLGVAAALTGMALMTLPEGNLGWNLGDLLTVGCAAAYALHIVVIGHWAPRAAFPALSVTQIVTVAALMLLSVMWIEPVFVRWSTRLAAALGVTGILSTALAFSIQAWAQRHTTATRTALIFSLEPVSAWLTAWLVTGEGLAARAAIGAVLILAGVLVVEWKPQLIRRHP
jgi:drug/metabolite transporter (DMT)-like permease